jgi:hypothetical protein
MPIDASYNEGAKFIRIKKLKIKHDIKLSEKLKSLNILGIDN